MSAYFILVIHSAALSEVVQADNLSDLTLLSPLFLIIIVTLTAAGTLLYNMLYSHAENSLWRGWGSGHIRFDSKTICEQPSSQVHVFACFISA